jgi:UDP-N-acetylmuramate--alanine ligase
MENVVTSYRKFIENTKKEGCAFLCIDDDKLRSIAKGSSRRIMRYGLSEDADIRPQNIELLGLEGSRFDLVYKNKALGTINLSILGIHNVLNSLAAIGTAMDLGVDFPLIKKIIGGFKGANRRFIVTYLDSDILVIDDYAHHPTEIKATLSSLADSSKRIVAVFQPHRYSRTKYLKEEFAKSFDLVDHLVITDIYSAHETPIDGVSAMDICEGAKRNGHKDVNFVLKKDIVKHLLNVVRPGDAIFILGAGDIDELPEQIVTAFKAIKFR